MINPKSPLVKLYHPKGPEILLDGENVCLKALSSFSYTFEEEDNDKGSLVLKFADSTKLFLAHFSPGSFYDIRWGYIGNLSPKRSIAINKASINYDRTGYTLKLEIIPAVLYKNAGNTWANTKAAMADGVTVEYHYWDEELESTVYVTRRAEGFDVESTLNLKTLSWEPYQRTLGTRDVYFHGSLAPAMVVVNPLIPSGSVEFRDNLIKEATGLERDYAEQTVMEALKDFAATRISAAAFVDARDNSFAIKVTDFDSLAWFTFSVSPGRRDPYIISCSIVEGSAAAQGVAHVAATIGVKDKEAVAKTSLLVGGMLPLEIVGLDGEGNPIGKAGTVIEEGGQLHFQYPSKTRTELLDPKLQEELEVEIKQTQDLRSIHSETLEQYQKHRQGIFDEDKLIYPYNEEGNPIAISVPKLSTVSTPDARILNHWNDPGNIEAAQMFDIKDAGWVVPRNIHPLTVFKSNPYGYQDLENVILGEEVNRYFNNIKAKLVIEGLPSVTIGFNFNVQGLSVDTDGKFHCNECTHSIAGGQYTTSIEGGKVPNLNTKRVRTRLKEAKAVAWTDKTTQHTDELASHELNCRFKSDAVTESYRYNETIRGLARDKRGILDSTIDTEDGVAKAGSSWSPTEKP